MDKEVKIYVRKLCPYSKKLMDILGARNIPFTKYDVESDPGVKSRIITRDGNTPVPQVEMNGRIIFDYPTEEALADEIESFMKAPG